MTSQIADVPPTGFPARCSAGEVEVMLLGTWHFAGSDGDPVKQTLDDVLTPGRQAQLADLAEHLARWAPDQIAVEWTTTFADSTTARYQRYQHGEPSESRNEIVQVAFRLAKRLGHADVYPIDYQMGVGNDSIEALFARRPDFKHHMDSLQAALQRTADSSGALFHGTTIMEQLRATNTEAALHGGNSLGFFGSFLAAGEGANYGGPKLLARWYERNFRMAHNLTRALRPETKRVLMLVGSGHVPPLRNIFDESPVFCPVSPLPYLQ
ncbi:MAG: DUF5694 domain-containing protein [Gemmatimonadota bacterium]|nr:DUF5694 domain-containing protein [Gemmatimonadota bacterium]